MATKGAGMSFMDRKFASSNGAAYEHTPKVAIWKPNYFFVYGTLMDPAQLQLVLHRKEKPQMLRASLEGWAIRMWGEYPALVDQKGDIIHGKAFKVITKQEEELLKKYETERYTTQLCWIDVEGKGERIARTFRWAGKCDELTEGVFDLKDWQLKRLEQR